MGEEIFSKLRENSVEVGDAGWKHRRDLISEAIIKKNISRVVVDYVFNPSSINFVPYFTKT